MKNLSTGTGLALLAGAILGSTIILRYGPADQAAHAAPPVEAARAIAAASTAQVTPTIVWFGACTVWNPVDGFTRMLRAWSDGRVEAMDGRLYPTQGGQGCTWQQAGCSQGWTVISDPNNGYNAAADINFDNKVDGNDLGQLLAAWGDAPRHDIPPSDCPLALINP